MDMHDFEPNKPEDGQDPVSRPQEEENQARQTGPHASEETEWEPHTSEETEWEPEEPKRKRSDGRYPYEDYYNGNIPNRDEKPRRRGSSKRKRGHRDHLLVPVAVFAGLLVAGCLVIVTVGGAEDLVSTGNGMQLQSDSEESESEKSGGDKSGSAETQPSASADEGESSADARDEVPETTLGSGTVLVISKTPEDTDETDKIESDQPEGALSLQEIYKKVIPSVVSITSTVSGGAATGTGIIMSEDGYIITNYHVIEDALSISVLLQDDSEYTAALVGGDETSDLAVLKIDADSLTAAEFGSSDDLEVGDEVVAIGDPLGTELRGTMTNGIISAINRDLTVNDRTMTLIQTNAALNNGNSGGPLINCYGQVVGINTMKMSSYYSSVEGLGFAIPISTAKPIIDELIEKGYVSGRPAIGITITDQINDAARAYYNIPEGVVVNGVTEGSDAQEKGLQAGDVIIAMDGTTVTSNDELRTLLGNYVAGETVRLTIWRNGETLDLEITLMDAHDNNG